MATTRTGKLSELTPDHSNANRGTERGRYALEASLRKYGAGRSILIDKHGRIIAGNKTAETAADVGIDDVIVVQTDGRQVVAVQRTDLDLDSNEARELAYADNRVGQLDLDFDPAQILADLNAGVNLDQFWRQDELDALIATIGAPDEAVSTMQEQARATLAERFLIPPFSVLDARQGYWQARKSAWIALGIQSELGRGEDIVPNGSVRSPEQDGAWMRRTRSNSPVGSPRDAASLKNGRTVRGDGTGKPLARGGVSMAMHNDPMQRKAKYDAG